MKILAYVSLGFALLIAAVLLLTRGGPPEGHPATLFLLIVLFGVPPIGAFWMMYTVVRYEKSPVPMLLLALVVPFSFVWYYFERVRASNVGKLTD